MSERPTLLSRGGGAPTIQPTQSGVVQGAFGDYRGVIAAGQGLSDAGNVGLSYATNAARAATAQKEHLLAEQKRLMKSYEDQTIKDLANRDKLEREASQSGVREQYLIALRNGTLPDDPVAYIDKLLTDADHGYKKRTSELRAHPLYKKAVSDDAASTDAIALRNSLLDSAITASAGRKLSERVEVYNQRSAVLLDGVASTGEKLAKASEFSAGLVRDNIPPEDRRRLLGHVGAKLYASIHANIVLDKQPVDEAQIRNSPLLDDSMKERLIEASRALAPKSMNVEDQNRVINEAHDILADGGSLTAEQSAAYSKALDSIPGAYKDSAAAAARMREVMNDQKASAAFGYLGANAADQGTYEDNVALNTALLSNDSAVQYLRQKYPDTDWSSIPSETLTKYRSQAFKRVAAVVDAVKNFQATKILDSAPTIKGSADAVTVAMRRAGSATSPEEATYHAQNAARAYQTYKANLTAEYDKRRIPTDLRPMIPELIMSDLDNAYAQEQAASAVSQFHNARAVFGREGTAAIVRRFANSRTGTLRDKSHLAAFAATQHFALFGSADGTIDNTLKSSDKAMFDVLSNLPEKRRQWGQLMEGQGGYDDLASKVYNSVYFQSNPDADKVLSGAAISAARSRTQSLQAMGHALAWSFNEPSILPGFMEMNKALITEEALRGAKEAGDRVGDFITAGNATLNRLSQSMSVVKVSMTNNTDRVYGVIPTSMAQQERWFQTPVFGGASSSSRFGETQSEVIDAISTSLFSVIDRTGAGNIADAATRVRDGFVRHTWLSWLSGTKLNDSIHPLPDMLRIPAGSTDITPNYAGLGANQASLLHPSTWGAAGDRSTVEALTILQHGALRPNPVTGRYELMVQGAGQPVLGSDEVPNWSYRPVRLEKTKDVVGFSINAAMSYHQEFRWKRSVGAAKTVFVDDPLSKENPDSINFAEAKLP